MANTRKWFIQGRQRFWHGPPACTKRAVHKRPVLARTGHHSEGVLAAPDHQSTRPPACTKRTVHMRPVLSRTGQHSEGVLAPDHQSTRPRPTTHGRCTLSVVCSLYSPRLLLGGPHRHSGSSAHCALRAFLWEVLVVRAARQVEGCPRPGLPRRLYCNLLAHFRHP